MDIGDALARASGSLMSIPGVVGVGEGEIAGQPAVLVMVSHLTPALREAVPEEVDGFPVKLDVVGEIQAFPSE